MARVDGYVIEGHVPAIAIKKLLAKRPRDIAEPGLPIGSPGMEMLGTSPEAYDVISFAADIQSVFGRCRRAQPLDL